MLVTYDISTVVYLIITYLTVYNVTLVFLFWVLLRATIFKLKTLYSFSTFSYSTYNLFLITLILFSIAGVPPFVGFFTKILVFILSVNNSFYLFYTLFFIIIFVSLYFYIQNIRFLYSTNYQTIQSPYIVNERLTINFYITSIPLIILISTGFIVFDDVITCFIWLTY